MINTFCSNSQDVISCCHVSLTIAQVPKHLTERGFSQILLADEHFVTGKLSVDLNANLVLNHLMYHCIEAFPLTTAGRGIMLAESSPSHFAGVESGLNGDDIIAWQLGASEYSKLSEKQQEYVDKIRLKLEEVQNAVPPSCPSN